MTLDELSSALTTRGFLAEGQQLSVDAAPQATASPWYVQVMMGACAWFAGLLLLAFVILGVFETLFRGSENWGGVLVIGLVACGAAAALYAAVDETSPFGTQFALSMSWAGQVGIALALGGMGNERTALWGMLIVELALVVVVKNRLHRVLTSVGAVIAWALATHEILFGELPGSTHALPAASYQGSAIAAMLWLVVWAPVAYAAWWLVKHEAQWMAEGREALLRPVTHGVIASLSIAPLGTHPAAFWMSLGLGSTRDFTDGSYGATALWPLLAVMLAMLSLALAFAIRNRPLIGLAIVFGLLEVSCFYYVLGTTLLVKSIVMIVLGAALMASAHRLATESK
jgi:hypothetical protein